MVSILSAKTKLQISKTKDPIAREYTVSIQQCCGKVESTGKGLNLGHFVSNIENQQAPEIYFDFYVKRGQASENRIKEVKNMCFSDRLSNHGFWANFFRLFLSSLAYEMFLLLS